MGNFTVNARPTSPRPGPAPAQGADEKYLRAEVKRVRTHCGEVERVLRKMMDRFKFMGQLGEVNAMEDPTYEYATRLLSGEVKMPVDTSSAR